MSDKPQVIMGRYASRSIEELDSDENEAEAIYLQAEYALAFGPKWSIWYEEENH